MRLDTWARRQSNRCDIGTLSQCSKRQIHVFPHIPTPEEVWGFSILQRAPTAHGICFPRAARAGWNKGLPLGMWTCLWHTIGKRYTPGHWHWILKSDIANDPKALWMVQVLTMQAFAIKLPSVLGESVGIPYIIRFQEVYCIICTKKLRANGVSSHRLWWPLLLLLDASELCTNPPWPLQQAIVTRNYGINATHGREHAT